MRVKRLVQEHNTMTRPVLEPEVDLDAPYIASHGIEEGRQGEFKP